MAREIVRSDQWQEFVDVYVRDKHKLGLKDWFEQTNPHALAQMMERMIETARQDYWQPDRATLEELKARYRELARRHDVRSDNMTFQEYVGLPGFGLGKPITAQPAQASTPTDLALLAPPLIEGMQLEQVLPETQSVVQALGMLLMLACLGAAVFFGGWRQWKHA